MADLDVLTLEEAKAALNIAADDTDTPTETELAQVVAAASRMCDQIYGPIVQRTVTDELYDGGRSRIWFDQSPVLEVDEVIEYASTTPTTLTAETNVSKPTSAYRLVNRGHLAYLERRSTGNAATFPSGQDNVVVTYEAGRYEDTDAVDARFKEAAAVVVVHLWQHRGAGSGAAVLGGEGPMFGAVPFSSNVLRDKLRAMFPDDARPPSISGG